jgi:hypothetical protein
MIKPTYTAGMTFCAALTIIEIKNKKEKHARKN